MIVEISQEFWDKLKEYNFKFYCEECVYFNEKDETCSNIYPNDVHRLSYYKYNKETIIFCREFEIS